MTRSYDPATGKLLWKLDRATGRSSATPLAVGDRLYVGTEFRNRGGPDDGGGFLFAVKPGGAGDITPPDGAGSTEFIAWSTAESGIQMASPVLCQGHIYLLERRLNIVHCIDAETGEKVYRNRIPRKSCLLGVALDVWRLCLMPRRLGHYVCTRRRFGVSGSAAERDR